MYGRECLSNCPALQSVSGCYIDPGMRGSAGSARLGRKLLAVVIFSAAATEATPGKATLILRNFTSRSRRYDVVPRDASAASSTSEERSAFVRHFTSCLCPCSLSLAAASCLLSFAQRSNKVCAMASVLVPIFYVIIVFGGLWVFSSVYRRRSAGKLRTCLSHYDNERDIVIQPRFLSLTFLAIANATSMSRSCRRPTPQLRIHC